MTATIGRMGERWFMQIAGIEGHTVLKGFEKWIAVHAYTWEATAASGAGRASGSRTGRVNFANLVVTATISVASPRLVEACATQRRLSTVVLSALNTGEDGMPTVFLSYELSDVVVMSVRHRDDVDGSASEEIELAYQTIEITYTPQDGRGGQGQPVTTVHDRTTA